VKEPTDFVIVSFLQLQLQLQLQIQIEILIQDSGFRFLGENSD